MTRRRVFLQVKPLMLVLLLALVAVGAAAAVLWVWRPWDPVPDELRAAAQRAEQIPGVVGTDVSYTVTSEPGLRPVVASSTVTVRLDADLTPDAAGSAARRASGVFESTEVPGADLTHQVMFEAGTPRAYGGLPVPPLDVFTDADPAGDVTDAYALWHAGALRVGNLMAWSEDAGSLVGLARFAADSGIATSVRTLDDAASYDSYGQVPAVAAVRLTVEASQRDGVETAAFTASTAPSLSVHLTDAVGSPRADDVVAWLEDAARGGGLAEPVAYTVSGPGYGQLLDGWIAGNAPPQPAKHTVPLPDDVTSWPADDDAPPCAGRDLTLSLSTPDAAAGSRYLSVLAANTSGRPCAVDGTPDLTFRDAAGEPQEDVTLVPSSPGVVPGRVVVPDGGGILATIRWGAMSTTNDPDVTTAIDVTPVPGADPARLVPELPADLVGQGGPTTLDVLDGAEVRISPWAQAADGWAVPDDQS